MLYFSRRSQVSSPAASLADRITIWYSPTVNWASTVTPRSWGLLACRGAEGTIDAPERDRLAYSTGGAHGSCSQYSTSRGAPIRSMLANTALGKVLTSCSLSTTGTGITIANAEGGPL